MKTKNLLLVLGSIYLFSLGCTNEVGNEQPIPDSTLKSQSDLDETSNEQPNSDESDLDDTSKEGYIVGYETCGLKVQENTGSAQGYIVITADLKDTLVVYGLPQDIYSFPAEAFPEQRHDIWENVSFPEQFRYAFKIRFACRLVSELELKEFGVYACVKTLQNGTRYGYRGLEEALFIIQSAEKIESENAATELVSISRLLYQR
jgi:hypothetical protein